MVETNDLLLTYGFIRMVQRTMGIPVVYQWEGHVTRIEWE